MAISLVVIALVLAVFATSALCDLIISAANWCSNQKVGLLTMLGEKIKRRWRSAITGRFVTKIWALFNKSTTVSEKVDD